MWVQAGYLKGLDGYRCIPLIIAGTVAGATSRSALKNHRIDYYVSDVITLMDHLGPEQTAFWGYSDGARVGYVLAATQPTRFSTLIGLGVTDTPPDSVSAAEAQWRLQLAEIVAQEGMQTLLDLLIEQEDMVLPDWLVTNFRTTDATMFALNMAGWANWPGPWSLFPQITQPALLVAGELEDPERINQSAAALMRHGRAVFLPGLGHVGAFLGSEQVLTHVRPFLDDAVAGML
ncbi:MAG: alpha/beta hydrolase [Anaerolineae bacterium]|nr:alpha/beta hydrolase [Anaerolineae bacterium]